MTTTLIITLSLAFSLLINIVFVWYTRNLLNYLEMTNIESREVLSSIVNYEQHLTDVYNRDIFYGDETLEALLEHTTMVADKMQEFVSVNENLVKDEDEITDA